MKNLKIKIENRKGITLVALIVTIIILLILAGVAISQLTDSGLFEKVKTAKEKAKNAQELENSILGNYENEIATLGSRETITIPKEEYDILKNANSYSTSEKVVGTWIDGRTPIYQKTFQGSYSLTTSISVISDIVVQNAMHLIDVKCIQDDGIVGDYYFASPSIAGFTSEFKLRIATADSLTAKYIRLTYTKLPNPTTPIE